MAQVTWTNVGGEAVNSAAQQSAAQTSSGADRIQKGLDTLIGMSKAKTERDLTIYNNIAENNLQEALNEINSIKDADQILEFDIDQLALDEKYGRQLGSLGKSEEAKDMLRRASEDRFDNLVAREEAIDVRNSRLDNKANEEIFAEYRALYPNRSMQELKDGWEDHVKGLDADKRRGKNIVYWGKSRIQQYSNDEESLTTGKRMENEADKADYLANANAAKSQFEREQRTYENVYENGAAHAELTTSDIESWVAEKLTEAGLDPETWWFDGGWTNKEAATEQIQEMTNVMLDVFQDQGDILRDEAIATTQEKLTGVENALKATEAIRPRTKEVQRAINQLEQDRLQYENNIAAFQSDAGSRFVLTKDVLEEMVTITNLFDKDKANEWWGKNISADDFKERITAKWDANKQRHQGRMAELYAKQTGSRASLAQKEQYDKEAEYYQKLSDSIAINATK
jgi:hypothetical protein